MIAMNHSDSYCGFVFLSADGKPVPVGFTIVNAMKIAATASDNIAILTQTKVDHLIVRRLSMPCSTSFFPILPQVYEDYVWF